MFLNHVFIVVFVKMDYGMLLVVGFFVYYMVIFFDVIFDEDSYDVSVRFRIFVLLGGYLNWVLDVVFNGDGILLVFVVLDKIVCVWDVMVVEKLCEVCFYLECCWSVVYFEDGKWLVLVLDDFKVSGIYKDKKCIVLRGESVIGNKIIRFFCWGEGEKVLEMRWFFDGYGV